MPTFFAQKVVNDAKTILQETTGVRWSDLELLAWVSAGQREIVMLVPSAYTETVTHTTVPGSRQQIAPGAYMLMEVHANIGGPAITPVAKHVMDTGRRGWRSETVATPTLHYVYDPRTPRQFFLYPPAPAGHQIEVSLSMAPPELTSLAQVIALDDIYVNPLLDYVLYRAYSKDLETVGNAERAAGHYAAFSNTLGLKAQAMASNQPAPAAR